MSVLRPKSFYVGTKFSRYREARAVIDSLVSSGYRCTHDWTRTIEFDSDGNLIDEGLLTRYELSQHAIKDIIGAKEADLAIFLAQEESCGWLIEIGAALVAGQAEVWLIAPYRYTVFWALPQVRVFDSLVDPMRLLDAPLPEVVA